MMENTTKRTSMGRQKIAMKRIEKEDSRQVTFSKRRNGLFKKANDLSVLCGAEVAVVVFSPGGRPYSYGHPSVEAVVDRFASRGDKQRSLMPPTPPRRSTASQHLVHEFERESARLVEVLQAERRRTEQLQEAIRAANASVSGGKVDDMGPQELEALYAGLQRAQADVRRRLNQHAGSSHDMAMDAAAAAAAIGGGGDGLAAAGFRHAMGNLILDSPMTSYDFGQDLAFGQGGMGLPRGFFFLP